MEYTVAAEIEIDDLIAHVNRLAGEGWKPQGGVAMLVMGPNQHYAQAMVRETAEEETIEVESGLLFFDSAAVFGSRQNERPDSI
jgi:hypothetical protein